MKISPLLFIVLGFAILFTGCDSQNQNLSADEPVPKEQLYLGQKPPGLKAEVFAPGIVTTEHMEFFGSFTPDLQEFYFKRKGGKYEKSTLVVIRYEDNEWKESIVAPEEASIGEPSLTRW